MIDAPVIDYDAHPAFAGLRVSPRADDARVTELADAVDAAYEALVSSPLTVTERQQRFDEEIAPKLAQLQRIVLQEGVRPQFAAFVRAAMEDARKSLRAGVAARSNLEAGANSDVGALSTAQVRSLDELRRDGFSLSGSAALARKVWSGSFVERALLRARARKDAANRCIQPLHEHSPAWRAIASHLRRAGLLDTASTYMGRPLKLTYMSLEYAHAGQSWYKDCYRDVGLGTADTVYMHFDADRDMLKVILYLQDVGPEDGPFGYIPGSHAWRRSPLTTAMQKGFDQCSVDFFETDGRDYMVGYYRPRFRLAESRRDLLSLPARLRGSTHFGDDIVSGTDASRELISREKSFTAPAGTLILFDGSQGIHRGAQVRSGSRWVVNIGLLVEAKETPPSPTRRFSGRLAYLKHTLGNLARLAGLR